MRRSYKNASSPHLDRTVQKVVFLGTLCCRYLGLLELVRDQVTLVAGLLTGHLLEVILTRWA